MKTMTMTMTIKNSKLQALYKEGFTTDGIMDLMAGIKTVVKYNRPLIASSRICLALEKVVKSSKT